MFDFVTEDPLNPDDVARSTALYIGAVASRVIRKLHCTTVYGHSRRLHPAVDRAVVDSAKIQCRSDLMMADVGLDRGAVTMTLSYQW